MSWLGKTHCWWRRRKSRLTKNGKQIYTSDTLIVVQREKNWTVDDNRTLVTRVRNLVYWKVYWCLLYFLCAFPISKGFPAWAAKCPDSVGRPRPPIDECLPSTVVDPWAIVLSANELSQNTWRIQNSKGLPKDSGEVMHCLFHAEAIKQLGVTPLWHLSEIT